MTPAPASQPARRRAVHRLGRPDAVGTAKIADQGGDIVIRAEAGPAAGNRSRGPGDVWLVQGGVASPRSARHQILTRSQAEDVAALVKRTGPIPAGSWTVEWAMLDGRIVLLDGRRAECEGPGG